LKEDTEGSQRRSAMATATALQIRPPMHGAERVLPWNFHLEHVRMSFLAGLLASLVAQPGQGNEGPRRGAQRWYCHGPRVTHLLFARGCACRKIKMRLGSARSRTRDSSLLLAATASTCKEGTTMCGRSTAVAATSSVRHRSIQPCMSIPATLLPVYLALFSSSPGEVAQHYMSPCHTTQLNSAPFTSPTCISSQTQTSFLLLFFGSA
jgi:hypothetical protein